MWLGKGPPKSRRSIHSPHRLCPGAKGTTLLYTFLQVWKRIQHDRLDER